MFPILQVGPLTLQTPGLFILLGVWMGLSLAEHLAHHFVVERDQLDNLIFTGLIGGLLGARVAYVLQNFSAFQAAPLSMLALDPSLMDWSSGLLIGGLAGWIYAQRKGMRLWPTLDALTPFFAVTAAALGFSHLASGQAFGAATSLPWAIQLWGAARHPSQAYEILAALIVLALIWPRKTFTPAPGITFLAFAVLTALLRIFLEAFRGDSQLLVGSVRTAQVIGWLVLAAAAALIPGRMKAAEKVEP